MSQVSDNKMAEHKIYACDFEVFGHVQGVFFRKYTEKQANTLGVRGWCMNTAEGTVKGHLQAPQQPLNEMKEWLKTKGSPTSKIHKVVFSPENDIATYTMSGFTINH